jgi:hypothetical protein
MNFAKYLPSALQGLMPGESSGTPNQMPQDDTMMQLEMQRRMKFADALRGQEAPQGQMVSGHYVAPSWTQQLASLANKYVAGKNEENAIKQYGEYTKGKQAKMAEALGQYQKDIMPRTEQAPQQPTVVTGSTGEIAPNMGMVNAPARQVPLTANDRYAALLKYSSATGNPQLMQQAMMGGLESANKAEDTAADRAFREKQTAGDQEFQRIQMKDRQGFELTQNEKQFANQMALQKSSQGFQAGQNAANAPLVTIIGSDGKPKLVPRNQAVGAQPYSAAQEAKDVVKVQQKAQNEISAQQVLDQAQALFSHGGRKAGTGVSSWMGSIPGTDAKDFAANLATFKAQTFVPMVSALKGMGALSDAEGKKLTESVGALDPSVNEAAFVKNLQNATKTLFQKAKAAGLNVSEPEFLKQSTGASATNAIRSQADAIIGR